RCGHSVRCAPVCLCRSCANRTQPGVGSHVVFFSSRKRHTRCYRDWSSDVCSSDLSWKFSLRLLPTASSCKTRPPPGLSLLCKEMTPALRCPSLRMLFYICRRMPFLGRACRLQLAC